MDFVEQVEEFMLAFCQTVGVPNDKQAELYLKLVNEEILELNCTLTPEEELDAICDSMWVLIGVALSRGYDIIGAMGEVARSNMSKLDENGKPIFRDDGKILKGPNYFKPDLRRFTNEGL